MKFCNCERIELKEREGEEYDAPDGEEKKYRNEDDKDHCLQPHYPNSSSSSSFYSTQSLSLSLVI